MAVVAEGERPGEVVGERLETREVRLPLGRVERAETDAIGPALVAKAEVALGESRGGDLVVQLVAQLRDSGSGAISSGNGHRGRVSLAAAW